MTTLIAAYDSDGCVGRCDARCYDAVTPDCDCICGGRNHGAGAKQATDNTRNLAQQWIDDWQRAHPGHTMEYEVRGAPAAQMELL